MDRVNSFGQRLSQRIDSLIEGHLAKNQPRELFIPGLDDFGKDGKRDNNGIFDLDNYDPDSSISPTRIKNFKAPHEEGEGTVTGNVGTFQTGFNMLKVFVGIGILATPASFQKIGIVGGVAGMIFIGLVATYTMQLQIAATMKCSTPVGNYSELGQAVLGDQGRKFVDFCIVAS